LQRKNQIQLGKKQSVLLTRTIFLEIHLLNYFLTQKDLRARDIKIIEIIIFIIVIDIDNYVDYIRSFIFGI